MIPLFRHAVRRRRSGLLGWALGLVSMVALVALSYPAVRGNAELDKTFAQLPPGVRAMLGLGSGTGLTSPVGYLDSQFFANLLPVLLLVFAIGTASWAIAGDEARGTLELLLANPVSRARVALARLAALILMLVALSAVTLAALLLARGPAGLGEVTVTGLCAAVAASAALALAYAAVAFALGAAGATRRVALGAAASAAVAGYVVEGLGQSVPPLRPVRAVMPWHWLLAGDPLLHGAGWLSLGVPLLVAAALSAAGIAVFTRRDLR